MFGFLLSKELHQEAAHRGSMSLQLLLFQDIQDGQPNSAGHWAAPKLSQATKSMSDAQQSGPCLRDCEEQQNCHTQCKGSDEHRPEPLRAQHAGQ